MTALLQKILVYALWPSMALLAGGLAAAFYRPSKALQSAILHFAAGVVFSVVAVEILPDIIRIHEPRQVILGFSLGVLAMSLVRHFTESKEKADQKENSPSGRIPFGLLVGIGIDLMLDGLLLGIGFNAGESEGTLLAFALAAELLSLGLATSSSMSAQHMARPKILSIISGMAGLFFLSAALGGLLLYNLPDQSLEIVLSFGLAALLYLVTEELLVEAHEKPESPWLTATFFAGFLLFLILGMNA